MKMTKKLRIDSYDFYGDAKTAKNSKFDNSDENCAFNYFPMSNDCL